MQPAMIREFISLLFPHFCYSCHRGLITGEKYICTYCRAELPRANLHRYPDHPILQRFQGLGPVDHVLAYLRFVKKGRVQKIMNKLKYENRPDIGTMLGEWYGSELADAGFSTAFDLILPVPLHQQKLRLRGYNQSDYFAKGLSMALAIAWNGKVLQRNLHSETQTRKSRVERFDNVSGIFELADPDDVKNKRILLVDDVITTGATLFSAAQPIIAAGCGSISFAALAVAR